MEVNKRLADLDLPAFFYGFEFISISSGF